MTAVLSVVIAALSLVFIVFSGVMTLLIRVIIRYTKTESKLDSVAQDLKDLMISKDSMQREMLEQMKIDRDATDRRLRYLEEWHMLHGK